MPRQIVRDFGTCLNTGNFAGSVSTAGAVNLSGSAISLVAWAKFRGFQTSAPYISSICGEEDATDQNVALLRMGDGSGIANNNKANFVFLQNVSSISLLSTTLLIPGLWYFIVGVYDGANSILYINGVQDNIVAQAGAITANTTFSASRSSGAGNIRQMNGLEDEIRAYTRALTPTEVLNLYYGIEPATTNLKVWWKFDEGSGTSATDSSGNSNTGTITSGTYSSDVFMKPRSLVV